MPTRYRAHQRWQPAGSSVPTAKLSPTKTDATVRTTAVVTSTVVFVSPGATVIWPVSAPASRCASAITDASGARRSPGAPLGERARRPGPVASASHSSSTDGAGLASTVVPLALTNDALKRETDADSFAGLLSVRTT